MSSPYGGEFHVKHDKINPAFSAGFNQFYEVILMLYFE